MTDFSMELNELLRKGRVPSGPGWNVITPTDLHTWEYPHRHGQIGGIVPWSPVRGRPLQCPVTGGLLPGAGLRPSAISRAVEARASVRATRRVRLLRLGWVSCVAKQEERLPLSKLF